MHLSLFSTQCTVPSILDRVVRPPWEQLGDLRPAAAQGAARGAIRTRKGTQIRHARRRDGTGRNQGEDGDAMRLG